MYGYIQRLISSFDSWFDTVMQGYHQGPGYFPFLPSLCSDFCGFIFMLSLLGSPCDSRISANSNTVTGGEKEKIVFEKLYQNTRKLLSQKPPAHMSTPQLWPEIMVISLALVTCFISRAWVELGFFPRTWVVCRCGCGCGYPNENQGIDKKKSKWVLENYKAL